MKALNIVGGLMVALLVLIFALCLITAALPARAQTTSGPPIPRCAGWADMAVALARGYGESVLFEGDPPEGAPRIVITVKPDGTTWTALTVDPSGLACIRGAGGGWSAGAAPVAPGKDG